MRDAALREQLRLRAILARSDNVVALARTLSPWHVHRGKGRRALERIAIEQDVDRGALFDAGWPEDPTAGR